LAKPDSIEQKAIDIVMAYEKAQGRTPKDVSSARCGFDIKSGDRRIEVKGQSNKRASWIWISNTIVRRLGKNLTNYYIYLVYDIKNKPKLKILDADTIFKNLKIDTLFLLTTAAINEHGKDIEI
jgi:hypothetical protein